MIRIASLFSGVGTPEQSLKHLQVEHETIFACEIDKYARQTYLANNQEPNTFYEDVYDIDGNKYKNQIDILIGGSPCQSFSIAGKRMGTSCPRGNLIYEYFRIVEESQPKVFIYENVKGFLSIDKGETFENFKNSFKEIGYTVYHQVLNTKDYGIPQNRERIYIVGFKDNVDFHFQEKQELKLRLKDMLEDNVDSKYLLNQELVEKYIQTGTASNHKGSQAGKVADETDEHFWTVNAGTHGYSMGYIKLNQTHQLNIKGNDSIKRIYSSDGLCPSLTTMQGGNREPKIAIEVIGTYNKPFTKRVNETPVEINEYLKQNKGEFTLKEISERTNIAKTTLEHYFRTDKSRSIPDANDWLKLKELLGFDDTFDEVVTEYKEEVSMFESTSRVYSIDGLSPCITSVNADKYIAGKVALPVREVGRRLDENGTRCDNDISIPITRRYEIGNKEVSNCLSGVQKDSYVAVANGLIEVDDEVRVKEAVKKGYTVAKNIEREMEDILKSDKDFYVCKADAGWQDNKIGLKTSPTIRANNSSIYGLDRANYIFRKLTPRECFRLQGFDDAFIFPEKMSDTQLYKQAGNGMSRNILDMIFTQIFTCYTKHIEGKQK